MDRNTVNAKANDAHAALLVARNAAREYWRGRWIVITDPHYNGQPWGHSKPSLIGHEFRVESVHVCPEEPREERRILLFVPGCQAALHLGQVREKHGHK